MRLIQQQQLHHHQRLARLHDIFIANRRSICLTRFLGANVKQESGRQSGGDSGGEKINRPDLKKSLGPPGPKRLITVACILVIIYMYPMIFRPLFGIGSSGKLPVVLDYKIVF